MSDQPVLDPATIASLRELSDDGEFLKEIAGIFLSDTPDRIAELETSQAAGDTVTFTRAAHSIKGSAANIGATTLGAAASRLEAASKAIPLGQLTPQIEDVKAEFAVVRVELEKLTA
jgi:HPt (histidine-containing phosphotransfer) domain-containing protein